MNYKGIKEQCEEMMAANFRLITQQTDFLNLDFNKMQHYMSDICSDTVNGDDVVDATVHWVSHEEERITALEDLLQNVQMNKCSDEGIKTVMKTHEALFDKVPMTYKLLLNTPVDTITPNTKNDIVVVLGGEENCISNVSRLLES